MTIVSPQEAREAWEVVVNFPPNTTVKEVIEKLEAIATPMNTETKCCEKCARKDGSNLGPDYRYCGDKDCFCHHPTPYTPPKNYDRGDPMTSHPTPAQTTADRVTKQFGNALKRLGSEGEPEKPKDAPVKEVSEEQKLVDRHMNQIRDNLELMSKGPNVHPQEAAPGEVSEWLGKGKLEEAVPGDWEEGFLSFWRNEYAGCMRSPEPALEHIRQLIRRTREEELEWVLSEVKSIDTEGYHWDRQLAVAHMKLVLADRLASLKAHE